MEKKENLPLLGIEIRFLVRLARGTLIILSELSKLLKCIRKFILIFTQKVC